MDFLDNPHAWESDFEESERPQRDEVNGEGYRDGYSQMIEGAVSQIIVQAIHDATQSVDPARQQEAASWLMICCPDIAEQVELPEVNFERMSTLAAAYVTVEGGMPA